MLYRASRFFAAILFAIAASSCTTTQAEFSKKPSAVSKSALCRTLLQSQDQNFQLQIMAELKRRGINPYDCYAMVQKQDQAAVALAAVALVGATVAVCANNSGCGSGGYYPQRAYPGNCRYDWQYDAAGNRCGRRSAASRPGGW